MAGPADMGAIRDGGCPGRTRRICATINFGRDQINLEAGQINLEGEKSALGAEVITE